MTAVAGNNATYPSWKLAYYAEVAASILGVESEHRTLGRVIANENPANNRNYELVDGIYQRVQRISFRRGCADAFSDIFNRSGILFCRCDRECVIS